MKIDADLRQAIKSVIENNNRAHTFGENRKERQAAIKELISNPSHRYAVAQGSKLLLKGKAICEQGLRIFDTLGVSSDLDRINDERKFVKAGGKLPKAASPLRYVVVMAQLAQATPADGRKILEKLGIDWEGK